MKNQEECSLPAEAESAERLNTPRSPFVRLTRLQYRLHSLIAAGPERKRFVGHVSATFFVRIVLIGIGVLTAVMTARILGPAGRGLYTAAIVLGAIGSQFGNLGLHSANTYYLGRDSSLLARLFSNSLCVAFGVGGGIALTLWTVFKVYPNWCPVQGLLETGALLLIPIGLAALLSQNLLLGIREVKWYNFVEVTNRAGFVAALIAVWLMMQNIEAWQVVFFALFGAAISVAIAGGRVLYLTRSFPLPSFSLFRVQASYGFRSYITCLAGYIVLKSDILLVKYIAGENATGLYSLASNMTDFIYTFPTVVGMILFPMLSATEKIEVRWRRAQKTMIGIAAIMSGISAAAAIFAAPVTRLAFGARFLPAVPAFLVLSVAIVFYGANSMISIFFSSCGQPWFSVGIWVGGALLNIGINLVAIPRWGIIGAAVSSLITYIALFVVQYAVAFGYVRQRRAITEGSAS
jgi:O-antigen/teichoic acid export membrane protein